MAHSISAIPTEVLGPPPTGRIEEPLPPPDARLEFQMATPQERFDAPWPEVVAESPGPFAGFGTSILSALESAASRVIQTGGDFLAFRTPQFLEDEFFNGHDLTPDAGVTLSRGRGNDFVPDFLSGQTPLIQRGQDNLWLWILLAVLAAVALSQE